MIEKLLTAKRVKMSVFTDENIYQIFKRFNSAARKADWTQKEIESVLRAARSGDYAHAVATILKYVD